MSVRTNWSWFIHPWRRQIDFIIGKHVVLTEPINKNIFEENLCGGGNSGSQSLSVTVTQSAAVHTSLTASNSAATMSSSTDNNLHHHQPGVHNVCILLYHLFEK